MSSPRNKKKKILFLAANPKNSTPLDLTREVKEIEAGLERSQQRNKFQLEQVWAVTPTDLQRAMLKHKPQIVHFSGHGMGEGGLVLENVVGQAQMVNSTALAGLFKLFAEKVELECVVLNACYSEVQAVAIADHIPYVVGMNQAVGDRAARVFAVGFYDALGEGESIDFAYELGRNRIALEGIAEDLIPVMRKKSDVESLPLLEVLEPIMPSLSERKFLWIPLGQCLLPRRNPFLWINRKDRCHWSQLCMWSVHRLSRSVMKRSSNLVH